MSLPSRVIYILIALALVIGLAGIAAMPDNVNAGTTKWTKVTTPSEKNLTILPGSNISDFTVGPDGAVIYAIGEVAADAGHPNGIALWKSADGGATWSDKTSKILKAKVKLDLLFDFAKLTQVAVAPDNADFVLVAGTLTNGDAAVIGSTNGAGTFYYTGDMTLGGSIWPGDILCMDVSPEVNDICSVALGTNTGYVLRYDAGGYWGAHWVDASAYAGWVGADAVTSIAFSPSWSADKTVLAISVDWWAGTTCLQTGKWAIAKGWGSVVERAPAVEFKVATLSVAPIGAFPGVTGMALPSDYNGYESAMRRVYTYVDTDSITPNGGYLFRIDNTALSLPCGPTGYPWFASIAYTGTHDEGDAMLGMLAGGAPDSITATACCAGIQVWRSEHIDVCCPEWKGACKKPSGQSYALVAFTPDGSKAYAATMGLGLSDESAFSVSLDKGKSWNQLGLIDTDIDYLSDFAASPDCSVDYLASVNIDEPDQVCECDSVWMKDANAEEYAGVWQRVYCKALAGDSGLLRLSPEHNDGDVVYFGDYGTTNLYWAESKGISCWNSRTATIDIQDFALADDDTVCVINSSGDLVKWTPNDWSSKKGTEVTNSHSIAVKGDYILVGGTDSKVGYSEDAADTFSNLGGSFTGDVHVAFDTYFTDNDTVYAAVAGADAGIYRWVIGQSSSSWKNLGAEPYNYYGIVTEIAKDGNPMTKAANGGVLYAATNDINWDSILEKYVAPGAGDNVYSGVARCLTPAAAKCCAGWSWDYLTCGMGNGPTEWFDIEPSNLKICGCLSADTNSNLFAIDNEGYSLPKGGDGTVWTWEDCFAKAAPGLVSPAEDSMLPADPCACINSEIVLKWERVCNACAYDIQVALDKGFTEIVVNVKEYDPPSGTNPSAIINPGDLECNHTYYWRVRVSDAEPCSQIVHSFWSKTWSFSVEAGPGAATKLTSPDDGTSNVPVSNVGFTWTAVSAADGYDFVLSPNADLSSPVDSQTGLAGTAYTFTGSLENNTTYYWQVNAMKGGKVLSASPVSTFRSAPAPPEPTPPPPPAPEPTTPAWVWVVIGIGAVLVIVVIVLIFRTRRV